MNLFFLSSGLFLGWSLGANDAANVFGTAVGTKMVRFKTAALICGVFVILGAVISGAGATHTLGALGAVNTPAGSFTVAGCTALTVFWMSRLKLPVSTSQAIIGGIIGWNFFTGAATDQQTLSKIVLTWVLCPILAAAFAMALSMLFKAFFNNTKIHLLRLDLYIRLGLLLVGAFGAYALGANNIANVMGVFVNSTPLPELDFFGLFTLSAAQQLFFLGGLAIAVGVYTYSEKVMQTIGRTLFRLSPEAALVVVLSHGLVLFLFASERLESFLQAYHLPTLPLVPVSSTQAVIGAIIGIGLLRGARGIHYGVLGEVALGWLITPVIAGVVTFIALFFVQNVFNQPVNLAVLTQGATLFKGP